MKKLGMRSAGKISKIWKKLNKEGLSIKGLMDLTGDSGFTSVSEDEVKEYRSRLTEDQQGEFDSLEYQVQKTLIAKIKEEKKSKQAKAELIDSIMANYYIIEDDIIDIVSMASEKPVKELVEMDIEEYMTLLFDVISENVAFFTSVVKLKANQ